MSLLGYPLASSQQDLTPLQYGFLEEALPRVEAIRSGAEPDQVDAAARGEAPPAKATSTKVPKKETALKKLARERREAKQKG
jgi:hypothetical protein